MGLLSDIFQQQQNIANNPTQAIRTPQQIAYDNLLNRQYDIEQQNKNYQTFNGIMSGVGGLGKIIASSMVKDPMQQAGAMAGIGKQEQRLDNLRQAYENVRNAQNKDYVTQAQQQLALARDDEDKAYNRDLTAQQIAYKKAMDEYQKEKDKADREYKDKELNIKENAANAQINKLNAETSALQNKPEKSKEDIIKLQLLDEELKKKQYENSDEYKNKQEYEKNLAEVNKLIERKLVNGYMGAFLLRHPEAYKEAVARNAIHFAKGKYYIPDDIIEKYEKKGGETINTDGTYKSSSGNTYKITVSGM